MQASSPTWIADARTQFFKKPCSAPGHTESVISAFPPESPHKIYDVPYWNSDVWDAVSYGRSYNPNQNFFDQFRDLFFTVPHLALERDATAVNSEYSLGGRWGKNNYYCGGSYKSEDCLYGDSVRFSKLCVDCTGVWNSEFCYGSVGADHCNRCIFVVDSSQCLDSAFLYDCKNCSHCFLSYNLRGKSYVFENKQLTKEEYQTKISTINLGDRNVYNDTVRRFDNVLKSALHRSVWLTNTVNCIGDRIANCKNCFWTFDGSEGENFRFVCGFDKARDSMDVSHIAENTERTYEVVTSMGNNVLFSLYIRVSADIEYSSECTNCEKCFGCVGLKNKKFHIFNKAYSENDYWKLVDEIKSKMLINEEYGELFSLSLGLFPYQASKSQKYYPLDEKKAAQSGIPWYHEPEPQIPENIHLRDIEQEIPSDIKNIDDSILNDAVRCEITGRPFRIVSQELGFYRHMNLPIPTKHPWQRFMERADIEHPLDLFPFTCPQCGEKSFSVYNENKQKQFKIFCEKCYLREIV